MISDVSLIILAIGIVCSLSVLCFFTYHLSTTKNESLFIVNHKIESLICLYIAIMVLGIALTSATESTTTMFWSINDIGLVLCLGPYACKGSVKALTFCFIYIALWIIGLFINENLITNNIKAVGININIIVFSIYILTLSFLFREKIFDEKSVLRILKCISYWGTITFVCAWILGFQDIMQIMFGSMGVYKAHIYGFFNGKNSYGIFLSLSFCADLYLYKINNKSWTTKLTLILKFFAIVFSFSRAALLQVVIVIFFFLWFERKRSIKEWSILSCICFVVLFYILQNGNFSEVVLNDVFRLDVGDAGRTAARDFALSKINGIFEYIFGVGYVGVVYYDIDIDNAWLSIFFTGGLIKLVIYLGLILYFFIVTHRLTKMNKTLGNICLSVGISYLVYGFFESIVLFQSGLINFIFIIFMYFIPCGYCNYIKKSKLPILPRQQV